MAHFLRSLAEGLLAATLTGSMAFGEGAEPSDLTPLQESSTSTASLTHLPSTVELTVGFADILRIEGDVSTIVLGDPSIADASPLDPRTILLTGRATGTTNMIVLDESGGVLADLMLFVDSRQPGMVTVRRALDTQTYSCASGLCEGSVSPNAGEAAPVAAPALTSSTQ